MVDTCVQLSSCRYGEPENDSLHSGRMCSDVQFVSKIVHIRIGYKWLWARRGLMTKDDKH